MVAPLPNRYKVDGGLVAYKGTAYYFDRLTAKKLPLFRTETEDSSLHSPAGKLLYRPDNPSQKGNQDWFEKLRKEYDHSAPVQHDLTVQWAWERDDKNQLWDHAWVNDAIPGPSLKARLLEPLKGPRPNRP